jgi:hypothetical protein
MISRIRQVVKGGPKLARFFMDPTLAPIPFT